MSVCKPELYSPSTKVAYWVAVDAIASNPAGLRVRELGTARMPWRAPYNAATRAPIHAMDPGCARRLRHLRLGEQGSRSTATVPPSAMCGDINSRQERVVVDHADPPEPSDTEAPETRVHIRLTSSIACRP